MNDCQERLRKVYYGIKSRCYNPNADRYKDYGAKGVVMCDEWKTNFQAFYEWAMASGYQIGLTIDRKDNSKGYDPQNCRWRTHKEQNNNRTNNHLLTWADETKTLAEWSEVTGIGRTTLLHRLKAGWEVEAVLFTPAKKQTTITYKGETKTLHEWAKILGIKPNTLAHRISKYGWTEVEAIEGR